MISKPYKQVTRPATTAQVVVAIIAFCLIILLGVIFAALASAQSISWTCDRCTPSSGTVSGTLSTWNVNGIGLAVGINNIIVTATDSVGGVTTDTLQVTYIPTFPGNTLAGAWGMETGSGTTATDSSGNSNNGTLENSAAWNVAGGRYGTGITLDGLTQSIAVPDANSLDFTQSFTFSIWVKPHVVHTDFRAAIVKNYQMALYASSQFYCADGAPLVYVNTNGILGPAFTACFATPLAINQWSHLAGTYDGTNLKLYVNGVLVTTTPATGYIEPTTGTLQIGASENGENFDGDVDEARVYNWAIPLTGGTNTVFGAACDRPSETATPSIIGDANCPVVPPATILAIKFRSSATGLKVGAGATAMKFGNH